MQQLDKELDRFAEDSKVPTAKKPGLNTEDFLAVMKQGGEKKSSGNLVFW